MKTIAQQLNIKNFPFDVKDDNGNIIYFEKNNGFSCKTEYDENGDMIYCEYNFDKVNK